MIRSEQVIGRKRFQVRYVEDFPCGRNFPIPIGTILNVDNKFSVSDIYIDMRLNPTLNPLIGGWRSAARFELVDTISEPKIIVRENKRKLMEVHMEEELRTIEDIATHLKVSTKTIRRYVKSGLPAYRIGRRLLFLWSEVNAWMRSKLA